MRVAGPRVSHIAVPSIGHVAYPKGPLVHLGRQGLHACQSLPTAEDLPSTSESTEGVVRDNNSLPTAPAADTRRLAVLKASKSASRAVTELDRSLGWSSLRTIASCYLKLLLGRIIYLFLHLCR